jgi:hypothetical protein
VIRAAVAQGWGVATAKACGQAFPDCSRCRRPGSDELRKSWGCDSEARSIVWESSCPRCAGAGGECARCEGTGTVGYRRCPSAMVTGASAGFRVHLDLLLRAYSHYDRRNVLPVRGAWLDQSRSFLAGVDLIDAERGYWQGLLSDHQEREMERQKRSSQMAQQRGRRR